MAVSKMQKWTIFVEKSVQETLLETVQELQHFEPIDWKQSIEEYQSAQDHTVILDSLQEKESQLQAILLAQSVLKTYVSKKVLKQRFSLTMSDLKQCEQDIDERQITSKVLDLQRHNQQCEKDLLVIQQKRDVLERWKNLPIIPHVSQQMKAIMVIVGTLPQQKTDNSWQELRQQETMVVEKLFSSDYEVGVIIYGDKKAKDQIYQQLDALQFTRFEYPFNYLPLVELEKLEEHRQQVLSDRQHIQQELTALAHHYDDLMLAEEIVVNAIERHKAKLLVMNAQSLNAVSGWLSAEREELLKESLRATLPANSYALLKDEAHDDESTIPIELTNHPLVEPFELLTEMYSLPKYSEIDPTPYLAPFYAIFFGMMIADIGYGVLMLFGTWYALKYMSFSQTMRKNLRLFHILSYPTILWGILFGSFFSLDMPFRVLSTASDATSILIISVIFGVIQLLFGLAINTQQQLKFKQYSSAVSDGLGWIGILLGVVLLVVDSIFQIGWLNQVAKMILFANVGLIILATMLGSKNKLLGIGSGLYKLYGISGYIGDLASYTRLMALCVAGASIGSSFNLIVSMLPDFARFTVGIVLFIVLHALNIGIAILGAYVHAIRLQFVEFFGKFYEGGGRKIKPLKTYEKYIDLKERKLEEY